MIILLREKWEQIKEGARGQGQAWLLELGLGGKESEPGCGLSAARKAKLTKEFEVTEAGELAGAGRARESFGARALDQLLELLYPTPAACPLCGQAQASLRICPACADAAKSLLISPGQCNRCGTYGRHGVYCPTCYHWPDDYVKNTALLAYEGAAADMIEKLKFDYSGYLARPIAQAIYNKLLENPALIRDTLGISARDQGRHSFSYEQGKITHKPAEIQALAPGQALSATLVIPVPMSKKRLREKGYNQAALLARQMAVFLNCPLEENILLRSRHTPHQTGLKRADRKSNLKNAFIISPEWVNYLKNKRVLLVDDVLTTSSTLQECAGVLLDSGAEKIYSVTIAAGNMPIIKRQPGRQDSGGTFPQFPQN